ncbi:polysaccharide deacetylase family protein [Defluviitoga tunisiensis]|uniref:Polysaccharide deacetylase n=1 Tax=Defluviitoga tunisiensis TaxID=1006576 RepID=A0A0C7P2R0_DEFTU|nr:polysaccharide deacetylase family protein [Defluviitoga tunisiensis]CEP78620.1 polysaccharide deacetylase [Defluviitoga tunisiensis]
MKISFSYYPEGKRKAVTMSYDDGQIYDRKLVKIFNKYGIKGTFHLNSGKFDTYPFLNASEINNLFQGHEVSIHTLNHLFLTTLTKETIIEEIKGDKENLESLVNFPVRGMSYPYGDYNEELVKMLPYLDIEYSRTVNSHRNYTLPENFLTWHPTCHHDDHLLERTTDFVELDPNGRMLLLYVWGHSFEFERNNNWDLIEEFCKTIGNKDEIWYATNIEIIDYINALKNLKFSSNQHIIFNPSALDLWIGVDGNPTKINSGEYTYL